MNKEKARQALESGKTLRMYMSGGVTYHFRKSKDGIQIHDGVHWNKQGIPIDDFFLYYDDTENSFRINE